MAIICKQCGYENPDGSTICEICAEPLQSDAVASPQSVPQTMAPVAQQPVVQPTVAPTPQPVVQQAQVNQFATPPVENIEATIAQVGGFPSDAAIVDDGNEYYVLCPESQTKTIVPRGSVTSFYCDGCKKQHEIDGFLWNVEKKAKQNVTTQSVSTASQVNVVKGDNLWLEEVNSHVRIDIDKAGGILGRYGKYG